MYLFVYGRTYLHGLVLAILGGSFWLAFFLNSCSLVLENSPFCSKLNAEVTKLGLVIILHFYYIAYSRWYTAFEWRAEYQVIILKLRMYLVGGNWEVVIEKRNFDFGWEFLIYMQSFRIGSTKITNLHKN